MSLQSEFADIAAADGRAALVTVIAGPSIGARLLVRADGSTDGGLGAPELDALGVEAAEELLWAERSETREAGDTTLFVDVVAPAPRLVIFGAVDYAASLARLARAAGDDRGRAVELSLHTQPPRRSTTGVCPVSPGRSCRQAFGSISNVISMGQRLHVRPWHNQKKG